MQILGYKDYTETALDPWEQTLCKKCEKIFEYHKSYQKPPICPDCEVENGERK